MSEGFPPEYRTVLERYYLRLAEEKSARAPGDPAKAKESAAPAKPYKHSATISKRFMFEFPLIYRSDGEDFRPCK